MPSRTLVHSKVQYRPVTPSEIVHSWGACMHISNRKWCLSRYRASQVFRTKNVDALSECSNVNEWTNTWRKVAHKSIPLWGHPLWYQSRSPRRRTQRISIASDLNKSGPCCRLLKSSLQLSWDTDTLGVQWGQNCYQRQSKTCFNVREKTIQVVAIVMGHFGFIIGWPGLSQSVTQRLYQILDVTRLIAALHRLL